MENALTPERHRFTGFANPLIPLQTHRGIRQRTVFRRRMISLRFTDRSDRRRSGWLVFLCRQRGPIRALLLDRAFAFLVLAILK